MCGVAGFLGTTSTDGSDRMAVIARMTGTLRHRGPDDSGTWVDPEQGIALGHRRLAVIDLSPDGRQPMASACGRYIIVFNGEIYNFSLLRRELEGLGQRFRGHSDTEVILAAIAHWGLETAITRFVGMFAFAVWDRCERLLHLVRDRLGKKPLYYGWMDGVFLFGSELKALRAHPGFRTEVNRDALALYLRYGYIPAPYSIYKDVQKLPPGTLLTVRAGDASSRPEPVPYWSLREVAERGVAEPFTGSVEEAVSRLDALLREAVGLRMIADVPLGAFLSGGVDSSAVVALMQAQSNRPVRTFTIGFHEAAYNEAEDARGVAKHLGTDHTELYVTPEEARSVIPRLPLLYDEPFADSSQIPTFLVSELARRHVTVSLSGDGGDELFGGYNRYAWGRTLWLKMSRVPRGLRRGAAAVLTLLSPQQWDTLFRQLETFMPGRLRQRTPGDKLQKLSEALASSDPEAFYLSLVSQWKEPESVVRGGSESPTLFTDRRQWARLTDFTQRMMYLDIATYLSDDILVKVDRASMGVSLEVRAPFLDHRVVEFAWRIPLGMKISGVEGKWLLRQVLYRYVPKELIDRPKMGFGLPIDSWLRGPLREWTEALLDERRLQSQGFFRSEPIRTKWLEHLSGRRNWQHHLWIILMFQAWLEESRT